MLLLYTVNDFGEFSAQERCALVRLSIVRIESRCIFDQLPCLLAYVSVCLRCSFLNEILIKQNLVSEAMEKLCCEHPQ
jgi:hypothetical protein